MIKGLVEIISGQSVRNKIFQVSVTDSLRRFYDSEYFESSKVFKNIAKAISMQTDMMIESLLCDEAVAQWKRAGRSATPQQIADLSIFCSHCLLQFTIRDFEGKSARPMDASLKAELSDLVRLMYGDFAKGTISNGLTFDKSLQSRDLNDPQEIIYLTKFLDQLMNVEQGTYQREVKVQKFREMFTEHQRAFMYTLHSVL